MVIYILCYIVQWMFLSYALRETLLRETSQFLEVLASYKPVFWIQGLGGPSKWMQLLDSLFVHEQVFWFVWSGVMRTWCVWISNTRYNRCISCKGTFKKITVCLEEAIRRRTIDKVLQINWYWIMAYASPIILVKKTNGSPPHLCVDYQHINKNTIPN